MRASAADRDRTLDVLRAAYGEGRLTTEEFESRAARTISARTYGELTAIVADLPAGPLVHQGHGYYPVAAPLGPTNGLAAASVVCSLIGLIFAPMLIPGIVMGHVAREQIRRTGERGDGMAIAGITFGYVGIVMWAFIIAVLVAWLSGQGLTSGGCPAAGRSTAPLRRLPAALRPVRWSSSASCPPSASRAACAFW